MFYRKSVWVCLYFIVTKNALKITNRFKPMDGMIEDFSGWSWSGSRYKSRKCQKHKLWTSPVQMAHFLFNSQAVVAGAPFVVNVVVAMIKDDGLNWRRCVVMRAYYISVGIVVGQYGDFEKGEKTLSGSYVRPFFREQTEVSENTQMKWSKEMFTDLGRRGDTVEFDALRMRVRFAQIARSARSLPAAVHKCIEKQFCNVIPISLSRPIVCVSFSIMHRTESNYFNLRLWITHCYSKQASE